MKLAYAFTIWLSCLTFGAHAIPAEEHRIVIAGPSPYGVDAGRKVFAEGGNVVDVAVAVGLTLAVTTPYYASLGGGGFALVSLKDKGPVTALDFRETAPAATGKDYFKSLAKNASEDGGTAVGVPGFAAGLWALHQKYGHLKWEKLFGTALELANQGFRVSGEWVHKAEGEKTRFNTAGMSAFFKNGLKQDKVAYRPGETLRQRELARLLTELRDKKLNGFYRGPVAADIVATVRAEHGSMTLEDLKNYRVRWLTPLVTEFAGHKIYLMPPPSSGGVIIAGALKMMELADLKSRAPLSLDELHLLAEIEARAFRGRALLGDPDFIQNPVERLTSSAYLSEMVKSIDLKKSVALKPLPEGSASESHDTTHFSIMDSEGNAVALTVTLNGNYGSGVVTQKFHLALNNEMDDFTTRPGEPNMYGLAQGAANAVEPGKRPLSSMSPTLVEKDGRIVMSLGAPGGPRIITAVLQALYRTVAQTMDIDAAIQFPRLHHQFLPAKVYVDRGRLPPETLQGLRARGHVVEEATAMGKAYVVRMRPDGILEGAFDARGEGAAGGF